MVLPEGTAAPGSTSSGSVGSPGGPREDISNEHGSGAQASSPDAPRSESSWEALHSATAGGKRSRDESAQRETARLGGAPPHLFRVHCLWIVLPRGQLGVKVVGAQALGLLKVVLRVGGMSMSLARVQGQPKGWGRTFSAKWGFFSNS